jgi:hypothetical protein
VAGVYLSEAPDPLRPPVKHCMNTCAPSHREGGRGDR